MPFATFPYSLLLCMPPSQLINTYHAAHALFLGEALRLFHAHVSLSCIKRADKLAMID